MQKKEDDDWGSAVIMCLQIVDAMVDAERIISSWRFLHKSSP